jgi:hypothetical protein
MSNMSIKPNIFNNEKSLLRKNYGKPKPVREYRRFIKDKIADTGVDTKGGMIELMKNDIIRPLERPLAQREKVQIDTDKWALKTQKNCAKIDHLPKIQQYKDYYFPSNTEVNVEKYKNTFLKTDNVAIRIPNTTRINEKESFLNLKGKLNLY